MNEEGIPETCYYCKIKITYDNQTSTDLCYYCLDSYHFTKKHRRRASVALSVGVFGFVFLLTFLGGMTKHTMLFFGFNLIIGAYHASQLSKGKNDIVLYRPGNKPKKLEKGQVSKKQF